MLSRIILDSGEYNALLHIITYELSQVKSGDYRKMLLKLELKLYDAKLVAESGKLDIV